MSHAWLTIIVLHLLETEHGVVETVSKGPDTNTPLSEGGVKMALILHHYSLPGPCLSQVTKIPAYLRSSLASLSRLGSKARSTLSEFNLKGPSASLKTVSRVKVELHASKIDAITTQSEDNAKGSWMCYCIRSVPGNKTYVGITNNVTRRLKQHNGDAPGGAKCTRTGRPWDLLCHVSGLPSRSAALKFEYSWKRTCRTSRTRSVYSGQVAPPASLPVLRRLSALEAALLLAREHSQEDLEVVWPLISIPVPPTSGNLAAAPLPAPAPVPGHVLALEVLD